MTREASALGLALLTATLLPAASDPLDIARQEFEAGNYPSAITTLQAALAGRPDDARVNFWLARCHYELSEFDKAIAEMARAVELEPQKSEFHQWLGRAYGGKAEREHSLWLARKTKNEFEKAVRLSPGNISARRDLTEYYLEAPWIAGGSRDRAREQVDAIAALDPVEGHLARALYWLDDKKTDLAEAEYRQVLENRPSRVEPYLEVADFYAARNAPAQMEQTVQEAARVDPTDVRLEYYRGVARVLGGSRLAEAERLLKSYLATAPRRSDLPSHASAREWLGRLYEHQGKRELAGAEYRAALQLDPGRKSTRERLKHLEESSH